MQCQPQQAADAAQRAVDGERRQSSGFEVAGEAPHRHVGGEERRRAADQHLRADAVSERADRSGIFSTPGGNLTPGRRATHA